jgi:hypothetical protein
MLMKCRFATFFGYRFKQNILIRNLICTGVGDGVTMPITSMATLLQYIYANVQSPPISTYHTVFLRRGCKLNITLPKKCRTVLMLTYLLYVKLD